MAMAERRATALRIGKVVLTVHDLVRLRRFYVEVVGLAEIAADPDRAELGVNGTVLLELRRDPAARVGGPGDAGLFHTAFLLPTRADLGRWLRHAAERQVSLQGMSDHVVSEAVYLADPEGNGIEIYADRPRSGWHWSGGLVTMRTDPLALQDLLDSAGAEPWHGVPDGTLIGHVHLQVGAIAPAEAFYRDVLGLELTARYPGGSFYASGGYHHHLATNIWNSRGAGVRSEPSTGLAGVELVVSNADVLDAMAQRVAAAGIPAGVAASRLTVRDPWGTLLTVSADGT